MIIYKKMKLHQKLPISAWTCAMTLFVPHRGEFRMFSRGRSFYPNLVTVEIACGLDAVRMQGSRVAFEQKREEDLKLLLRNADNAVEFLCWAQDRVPEDAIVGYGGLGYGGLQVMEQRLDVTGHALSGMSKLVCNV